MGEGSGQGCNRRGQPTQAGALPSYKSPSTQLEPVKGCAHPAESTALGGQPAPCGGWGRVIWCVPICVPVHRCANVLVCLCARVCMYLSVLHMHVCGDKHRGLGILVCATCLHILCVCHGVCLYVLVCTERCCVSPCVWMLV